jgi:hypothetical protein
MKRIGNQRNRPRPVMRTNQLNVEIYESACLVK